MKIFHIADLHIGKQLNYYSLKENQEDILNQIIEKWKNTVRMYCLLREIYLINPCRRGRPILYLTIFESGRIAAAVDSNRHYRRKS